MASVGRGYRAARGQAIEAHQRWILSSRNAIESAGRMIVPQQRELLAYRNARSASGLSTLVIDTALVNT